MRLLNSVCKAIASAFEGVPVHIEEVPDDFERGSFYVSLTTGNADLLNFNVYRDTPIYQIIYFGKRNEADQVIAEELYDVKERLKRIFLLNMVLPVLPKEDVKERARYAKIESYSDEMRMSEGAVYVRLVIDFTEDIPKPEDNYEIMKDINITTKIKR